MEGYINSKEAAELWGVTSRRVSSYCMEGRIPGAELISKTWFIPKDTEKPEDTRSRDDFSAKDAKARPFIKWAGGKGQLLEDIDAILPAGLGSTINKYAEPFVGGGAVLFHILSKYDLEEVYISDINRELIRTYTAIRNQPEALLELLSKYQTEVDSKTMDERKDYFLEKRKRFNEIIDEDTDEHALENAALFILLNKMCFNGLYRVNSKGHFNVPCGRYKNPLICDRENILNVSAKLQNVIIHNGTYRDSADFIDEHTFVYFDPPYRPLSETSNFNEYAGEFNDDNQRDLAQYFNELKAKGAFVALSNSDPKNTNPDDEFFDELYAGNHIHRVFANRMINANGANRGAISELLITSYEVPWSKEIDVPDETSAADKTAPLKTVIKKMKPVLAIFQGVVFLVNLFTGVSIFAALGPMTEVLSQLSMGGTTQLTLASF